MDKDFKPYRPELSNTLTQSQTEQVIDLIQQQIADFAGTSTYRRGIATGIAVNDLTLTSQAVGFTIAGGSTSKTLTVAGNLQTSGGHDLVLTTSGSTSISLPTSGLVATTSNKLSAFAAATSTEMAGKISDGASGTFTTVDGKTVTVASGFIISIV